VTAVRQEFEAVFEDNVLRPLTPVPNLPEHVRLRVTVEVPEPELSAADREARVAEIERLADELASMMTDEDWKAIEDARLDQKHFFDRPKS
jgi:predicted DNA-binding antitoxin AbrB/MazE fold protein